MPHIPQELQEFRNWNPDVNDFQLDLPESLPQRPEKFNSYGKPAGVTLNTFNVIQAPTATVQQYDVSWSSSVDPTKRALVKKLWNSKAVKATLSQPSDLWIYDGNKLAWSTKKFERDETRIPIDLDAEEAQELIAKGKHPRKSRDSNKHTIFIRRTRQVDFRTLQAFLNGQVSWSPECIDTINFLDHLMREYPSQQYTQIKKSFFQRGEARFDLGGGVEAFKGVFSSLRPVLNDKFQRALSVNVDVANGTFWRAQELTRAIAQVFNCNPQRKYSAYSTSFL